MEFVNGVFQSVVGNILSVVLVGVFAFIVWARKQGFKELIKEVFFGEDVKK